jgi:hypothetical protein
MATTTAVEIPKEAWRSFFDDVNRLYQGWAVTIEVLDRTLGDQRAADALPLQGISYETSGSQAGDIVIDVGDLGMPIENHLVHRPRMVRAAMLQPGSETDIEIESDDGIITLIRLRQRPELPPASSR